MNTSIFKVTLLMVICLMINALKAQDTTFILDKNQLKELKSRHKESIYKNVRKVEFVQEGGLSYYLLKNGRNRVLALLNHDEDLMEPPQNGSITTFKSFERITDGDSIYYLMRSTNEDKVIAVYDENLKEVISFVFGAQVEFIPKRECGFEWHESYRGKELWPVPASESVFMVDKSISWSQSKCKGDGIYSTDGAPIFLRFNHNYFITPQPCDTQMLYLKLIEHTVSDIVKTKESVYAIDGREIVPWDEYEHIWELGERIRLDEEDYYFIRFFEVAKNKNGVESKGAFPINEADIQKYGVVPIGFYDLTCKDGKLLVKKDKYSEWEEFKKDSNYTTTYRDLGEHYFRAQDYDNVIKFYSSSKDVNPWGLFYSAESFYEKAYDIESNIESFHYWIFNLIDNIVRPQMICKYLSEESFDIDLMRYYYLQAHKLYGYYIETNDEEFKDQCSSRYRLTEFYEEGNDSESQKLLKEYYNEINEWLSSQIAGEHPEYAQYRAQYNNLYAEREQRVKTQASFWNAMLRDFAEKLSQNLDDDKQMLPSTIDTTIGLNTSNEELAEAFYADGVTKFQANRLKEALEAFRTCDSLSSKDENVTITGNTKHWISYILYQMGKLEEAYHTDYYNYKLLPVDYRTMLEPLALEKKIIESLKRMDFETAYNLGKECLAKEIELLGENHDMVGNVYFTLAGICENIESKRTQVFDLYDKALAIFDSYGDKTENIRQSIQIRMVTGALATNQIDKAETLLPNFNNVISEHKCEWFVAKLLILMRKSDVVGEIETCRAYMASIESRSDTANHDFIVGVLANELLNLNDVNYAIVVSTELSQFVKEVYGNSSLNYLSVIVIKGILLEKIGRTIDAQVLYTTSFQDLEFSLLKENIVEQIMTCPTSKLYNYVFFSIWICKIMYIASNTANMALNDNDNSGFSTYAHKLVSTLNELDWHKYKGQQKYDVLSLLYIYPQFYLALEYAKKGEFEKVIDICEKIQPFAQFNMEYYANIQYLYGMAYFFKKDFTKALPHLEECVNHSADVDGSKGLLFTVCHLMLNHQSPRAIELCKTGYEKYRNIIITSAINTSQVNKIYTWNQTKTTNDMFAVLANMSHGKNKELNAIAYNSILFGKSFLLSSQVDVQNAIFSSSDTAIVRLYEKVRRLYARNANTSSDPTTFSELLNAESELMSKLSNNNDFTSKFTVTIEDVKRHLSKRSVAVEFVYSQKDVFTPEYSYYAYVLRNDWQYPEQIKLSIDEDKLKKTNIYLDEDFSAQIWEQIISKANLQAGDTIFFAADRNLHTISMENLLWKNNQPISSIYNMCRLTSTRELALSRQKKNMESIALFGGLDYYSSSDQHYFAQNDRGTERVADRGLVPLPATKKEVVEIAKIFKDYAPTVKVKCYTGMNGSEKQFSSLSRISPSIIHIATHGDYIENRRNAMESSVLYLSGADDAYLGESTAPHNEDGILSAAEIMDMDLSNVDLVVLSACNTATGNIGTDGVEGLQRGFKMAGAQSILMSLWNVNDDATSKLMTEFYNNLIVKKMTKSKAFQAAKTTVRNTPGWESPKFWAAFVLLDALD